MFENAARLKYRFSTTSGVLSVEDLWQLPLTSKRFISLNGIARNLYQAIKSTDDLPDFVNNTADSKLQEMQDKFEIVKHIIEVLKAELDATKQANVLRNQKALLVEILHEKKNDELKALSVEDLEKRLAEM